MLDTIGTILFGIFGLAVLISIAFAFSAKKQSVDWKLVAAGIGLQLFFAVLVIIVPGGREFFDAISRVFVTIVGFTTDGAISSSAPPATRIPASASCLPSRCCRRLSSSLR